MKDKRLGNGRGSPRRANGVRPSSKNEEVTPRQSSASTTSSRMVGMRRIVIPAHAQGTEGVGYRVSYLNDALVVTHVKHYSPAYDAGLYVGDLIETINGTRVDSISYHGAIEMLNGPKATTLYVTESNDSRFSRKSSASVSGNVRSPVRSKGSAPSPRAKTSNTSSSNILTPWWAEPSPKKSPRKAKISRTTSNPNPISKERLQSPTRKGHASRAISHPVSPAKPQNHSRLDTSISSTPNNVRYPHGKKRVAFPTSSSKSTNLSTSFTGQHWEVADVFPTSSQEDDSIYDVPSDEVPATENQDKQAQHNRRPVPIADVESEIQPVHEPEPEQPEPRSPQHSIKSLKNLFSIHGHNNQSATLEEPSESALNIPGLDPDETALEIIDLPDDYPILNVASFVRNPWKYNYPGEVLTSVSRALGPVAYWRVPKFPVVMMTSAQEIELVERQFAKAMVECDRKIMLSPFVDQNDLSLWKGTSDPFFDAFPSLDLLPCSEIMSFITNRVKRLRKSLAAVDLHAFVLRLSFDAFGRAILGIRFSEESFKTFVNLHHFCKQRTTRNADLPLDISTLKAQKRWLQHFTDLADPESELEGTAFTKKFFEATDDLLIKKQAASHRLAFLVLYSIPVVTAAVCNTIIFLDSLDKISMFHAELQMLPKENSMERFQHLSNLDYTVREALRLDPPVRFFTRRVDVDQEVHLSDDVTLPSGSQVWFTNMEAHRCPEHWDRPNTFDPHRWMRRVDTDPLTSQYYFPFGPERQSKGTAPLCFALTKVIVAGVYRDSAVQMPEEGFDLATQRILSAGATEIVDCHVGFVKTGEFSKAPQLTPQKSKSIRRSSSKYGASQKQTSCCGLFRKHPKPQPSASAAKLLDSRRGSMVVHANGSLPRKQFSRTESVV